MVADMGYKTKVQVIRRARSQQFYVCFPSAMAQAMGLHASEVVEWVIEGDGTLVLKRTTEGEGTGARVAQQRRKGGGANQ
jgi:antitoxin component of MazEF toxin-antitoxin module